MTLPSTAPSPWLERPEWAAGRISDGSRGLMGGAWFFALFWNAIAWPTFILAAGDVGGWRLAAAAVFPVVGVGLLVWAVRATLQHIKFGTSELVLDTVPGVIGGALIGTVRVPGGVGSAAPFTVTLRRVVRRTSGAGKNRSTTERIEWEERTEERAREEGRNVLVPVRFRIPGGEGESTPDRSATPRTLWRVEVAADVPGVDYRATFEVPVFRMPAGTSATLDATELPEPADPAAFRQPPGSRITVSTTLRGTAITFPPARNPGVAAGTTVFLVVWLGAIYGMHSAGAPLFFLIVFGLFGLLLLYATLHLWLGVTRVTVEKGSVTLEKGLLVPRGGRTFDASEISDFSIHVGMQAGHAVYYDIRLLRTNGRRTTAAAGIRDKREAEWLVWTMRRALAG